MDGFGEIRGSKTGARSPSWNSAKVAKYYVGEGLASGSSGVAVPGLFRGVPGFVPGCPGAVPGHKYLFGLHFIAMGDFFLGGQVRREGVGRHRAPSAQMQGEARRKAMV